MNVLQMERMLEMLRQVEKLADDEEVFRSWTGKEERARYLRVKWRDACNGVTEAIWHLDDAIKEAKELNTRVGRI